MKKNEKTTPNYHVHSFMLELGLTTSELMFTPLYIHFPKANRAFITAHNATLQQLSGFPKEQF